MKADLLRECIDGIIKAQSEIIDVPTAEFAFAKLELAKRALIEVLMSRTVQIP
ncbi:MAG: hypothetical protein ABL921_32660 [Pirellula sp.]